VTDKEHAVMNELWRTVNPLRWQDERRLAEIRRYREWLQQCQDRETRKYYRKWLDWLDQETTRDQEDVARQERVHALNIERPL
jgi:hypothetical protein